MTAIERAKRYGLTLLEYSCMLELKTTEPVAAHTVLCRLEVKSVLLKVSDGPVHYDAVHAALNRLVELGIACYRPGCWDGRYWLTYSGEDVFRKLKADGAL